MQVMMGLELFYRKLLGEGPEHVTAYASRTLTGTEQRYCVTRKEMLALVWGSHHFHPYLYGRKFVLRTDHSALQWLHRAGGSGGKMAGGDDWVQL